ncbi:MAG: hypothetical protein R3B45_02715 [Bdellovibrionota bacterium]
MKMRVGKEGDLEELHKLRSKSIKALCGDIYSKEQLIAWCNRRVDEDAMLRDLERGYVYVFVDKGAMKLMRMLKFHLE